jgi:hypothetical protein
MKVDYIAIMQEYHGKRSDVFITDVPMFTKLKADGRPNRHYSSNSLPHNRIGTTHH